MALETDGQVSMMVIRSSSPSMVTTEIQDGPIDLSTNKDILKTKPEVPPLIPINRTLLKKRWIAQSEAQEMSINSNSPPGCIPLSLIQARSKKRRADELEDEHVDSSTNRDEDSREWDFRLDRAHSVPHLRCLPPLVRCKSLSESRISSEQPTQNNKPVEWLLDEQELQRQRLQQMQIDLANFQPVDPTDMLKDVPHYDPVLGVGYYTQLLRFQAQEMLRRFSVLEDPQHTLPDEQLDVVTSQVSGDEEKTPAMGSDDIEVGRRTNRPLTGKHVRSGTGASPSTLLNLRKKIQARQQMKGSEEPKQ